MLNRFAKLNDYMESEGNNEATNTEVSQQITQETTTPQSTHSYVPKSVFQRQRYEPKNPMPSAFVNTRRNNQEQKQDSEHNNNNNKRVENPAFSMRRNNPMDENSAFSNQRRNNPMDENSAFSNQRRNNPMDENSAFSQQRRQMNDNPAFASKKRNNEEQHNNEQTQRRLPRHQYYVEEEPPKPKKITDIDMQDEELFPTLGSPKAIKTPSATTTTANTATNTPKAQALPLSSSFKDLVVKAAEKEEQAKKAAEEKKRRAKEKEMERRHTRVISFSIRTPGIRPQFSYDDDLGDLVDPAERTPYCSRIEEDDDLYDDASVGLDEDNY
jgi:hypothetical protein